MVYESALLASHILSLVFPANLNVSVCMALFPLFHSYMYFSDPMYICLAASCWPKAPLSLSAIRQLVPNLLVLVFRKMLESCHDLVQLRNKLYE